jgi:hypothetical protein
MDVIFGFGSVLALRLNDVVPEEPSHRITVQTNDSLWTSMPAIASRFGVEADGRLDGGRSFASGFVKGGEDRSRKSRRQRPPAASAVARRFLMRGPPQDSHSYGDRLVGVRERAAALVFLRRQWPPIVDRATRRLLAHDRGVAYSSPKATGLGVTLVGAGEAHEDFLALPRNSGTMAENKVKRPVGIPYPTLMKSTVDA